MSEASIGPCLLAGGTSGIGLATARALTEQGATQLILVGRSAERAAAAVGIVKTLNPAADVRYVTADLTTPAGAQAAVDACVEAYGAIGVLVSSAGGHATPRLAHELPLDDLPRLLGEITSGVLLPVRAALPHMMKAGRGAIVCVASDAAKVATPGETVIGAAMAAIVMFCRGLAIEAKRSGIRVNVVTPSIVTGTPLYDTIMADPFAAKLFGKAERLAHLGATTPDDVAAAIAFLASPAASRITGQALSVNGGISAA